MDMSKLPKFSQTPPTPPSQAGDQEAGMPTASVHAARAMSVAPPGNGAEAWISIGVGILLLIFVPNALGYFSSKLFHTKFEPYPDPTRPFPAKCDFVINLYPDGTKATVYYRDMPEFWSDVAVTAFAFTLLLDGIVMVRARKPLPVLIVLCITVAATVGNLIYLVENMSGGVPIISALAVLFGGYIAMYQWSFYKALRENTA